MTQRPVDVPGWDSDAVIVDERFVERVPRRPVVRDGLARECRILPAIAPLLPLPVPVPSVVAPDASGPWRVRHALVPGSAAEPSDLTSATGEQVGHFLRVLHDLPLHDLDLPSDPLFARTVARMRREVVPLLDPADQEVGRELLERISRAPATNLVHHDLGPAHVLVANGVVTGIIDWTDACLGDPAIDLAWVLHGTPEPFREAVRRSYLPTAAELDRSLDWHRLGPWHEVLYGIDEREADYVESGLRGVRQRLRLHSA